MVIMWSVTVPGTQRGATVTNMVTMLSRDFLKLVGIASLIAFPVAGGHDLAVDYFAYRISIDWWIFIAAGAIALLIALVTVSFQAIRAAIAEQPAKSLRAE